MKMWYVLHTYPAQEDNVKEMILKGIKDTKFESLVGDILIPRQKTYHIREGKKIERESKIFKSYVILECELTTQLYSFIIQLAGVQNFLGGKKPYKLDPPEVDRLLGIDVRAEASVGTFDYFPNDKIKIINGPFADFEGIIEKVNQEGEKLVVKVMVFGRVTPVEVNMDQVELL